MGHCPRCGGALTRRSRPASLAPAPIEFSERCEATVLFCDLGGYTEWNEQEDPEEVALAMDAIRAAAVRIFESYGGVVNQFIGDEIMGLFGVTSSHEDDPCRAVAAALALHDYVRMEPELAAARRRRQLQLHSGAETGLVFARMHDFRSGLFAITGDAVNTAARLRALADVDSLLVGPATAGRIGPFFKLEPRAPTLLHGKAQTIVPQRVLGGQSTSSRFEVAARVGLTQFVNRVHERSMLSGAWRQAVSGTGAVMSIGGEPGVGKTRLLHEFSQHVLNESEESPWLLHGQCSAYHNVAPYQPFIDSLERHLRQARNDEAATPCAVTTACANALAELRHVADRRTQPGQAGSVEQRDATLATLVRLMGTISQRRPLLWLLEDWHWADEASRAALRELSHHVEHRRVLILVNFRTTELVEQARPRAKLFLDLAPLSSAMTQDMACNLLGGQLPSELSDFLHTRTLGNPFFLEEVCRALSAGGTVLRQSEGVRLLRPLFQFRAPATVQAMVRARLDRLAAPQREVLRIAAVIGVELPLDNLEALVFERPAQQAVGIVSRSQLLAILSELEAQHMLKRAGTSLPPRYRFEHAITREVVYESVPVHCRRDYHGRIATLIEARTPESERETCYETLAYHYQRSHEPERAIEYCVRAGDKAWSAFSLEQAARQYQGAAELLHALAGRRRNMMKRHIDVSLSWARVGVYNPRAAQVSALLDALAWAQELGDARRACLCLNWLSWIEHALGDQRAALEYGSGFLAAAEQLREPRLIAQAYINVGLSHCMSTQYDAALAALENGIARLGRREGASYAYARGFVALIHGDRGDFALAYEALDDATRALGANSHITLQGPLLIQRGMVQSWEGAYDACMQTAARAREIAERIEGGYILGMSQVLEGYSRYFGRADVSAIARMRDAVGMLQAQHIGLYMSFNLALLAEACAKSGDWAGAQQAAAQALQAGQTSDCLGEAAAQRVLARVYALHHHDKHEAQRCLQAAQVCAAQRGSPRETQLTAVLGQELSAGPRGGAGDSGHSDTPQA